VAVSPKGRKIHSLPEGQGFGPVAAAKPPRGRQVRFEPDALAGLYREWGAAGLALIRDLIHLFLADAPARLHEMREAYEAGSLERMERAAHSLKGSCSHVGARAMQKLSAGIERNSRLNQTKQAGRLLGDLEREYQSLRPLLEEFAADPQFRRADFRS